MRVCGCGNDDDDGDSVSRFSRSYPRVSTYQYYSL